MWFDSAMFDEPRTDSPRTVMGHRFDVEGEEGFLVAGVGSWEVADGGESGGAGGGVVGSVGAFVEVGAGVPGDKGG